MAMTVAMTMEDHHHSSLFLRGVEEFVKEKMRHNDPSHDWLHVKRVRSNALMLANKLNEIFLSGGWRGDQILSHNYTSLLPPFSDDAPLIIINLKVVELAALLHDVTDPKYYSGSLEELQSFIRDILSPGVSEQEVKEILFIISNMSFRKELLNPDLFSALFSTFDVAFILSFACVQDADRLDALGAIGIARCFAYESISGAPFYSIEGPKHSITYDEYVKVDGRNTSINHFHEKLFKLGDLIKTAPGSVAAKERTEMMRLFVRNFYSEISIE